MQQKSNKSNWGHLNIRVDRSTLKVAAALSKRRNQPQVRLVVDLLRREAMECIREAIKEGRITQEEVDSTLQLDELASDYWQIDDDLNDLLNRMGIGVKRRALIGDSSSQVQP